MTNCGIYAIRHRATGKTYVGRSVDIKNRWALHKKHTEQGRDRSPLHRAFRKYGYDAFDWIVLVEAPAEEQVALEESYIKSLGTMVPAGYNVGGAAGGKPSRTLIELMNPEAREQCLAEMRQSATRMHTAISERRKDPEYEATYRATKSEAAKKRWAERKARLASDPVFAAEADEKWKKRAAKAAETIRRRKAEDPEFAAQLYAKMSAAAKAVRARDPRAIAAQAR